jgi:hypothetical protein
LKEIHQNNKKCPDRYSETHTQIHKDIRAFKVSIILQLLPWTGTGEELAVEQIVLPVIQFMCQKYQL